MKEPEILRTAALLLTAAAHRVDLYHQRRAEWRRGGLPTSSISDGPAGNNPPLPLPDRIDARLDHDTRRLHELIRTTARNAAELDRILNAWLIPAPVVPEKVDHPCQNVACTNVLEGNRQSGECARCRQHRSRHGQTYPSMGYSRKTG